MSDRPNHSINVAARAALTMMFALFVAAGAVSPAHSAEYLTTKEIREFISGRPMTFYGRYNGFKFTGSAKWNSNGTIVGRTRFLGFTHEWKGHWHVRDNLYCRTLSGEGRRDSQCQRVQKIDPRTIRFIRSDGSVSSTSIVR